MNGRVGGAEHDTHRLFPRNLTNGILKMVGIATLHPPYVVGNVKILFLWF
jgi:hypothetical protein